MTFNLALCSGNQLRVSFLSHADVVLVAVAEAGVVEAAEVEEEEITVVVGATTTADTVAVAGALTAVVGLAVQTGAVPD